MIEYSSACQVSCLIIAVASCNTEDINRMNGFIAVD